MCGNVTSVGIGEEMGTDCSFQKIYILCFGKIALSKQEHAWIFKVGPAEAVDFLVYKDFSKIGVTKVIHSDKGRQFISSVSL